MNTSISLEEAHAGSLKDPDQAALYLSEMGAEGDLAELMLALRHIVQINDGIRALSELAELNRESLYRTLGSEGNPKADTLLRILKALKIKLAFLSESEWENVLDFRYDRLEKIESLEEAKSEDIQEKSEPSTAKDKNQKSVKLTIFSEVSVKTSSRLHNKNPKSGDWTYVLDSVKFRKSSLQVDSRSSIKTGESLSLTA